MRIVVWNCNGGFARKRAALDALAPDAAILCEVPGAYVHPDATAWVSHGPHPAKHLAVGGFGDGAWHVGHAPPDGLWCASLESDGFGVLGLWTVQDRGRRYGDQVLAVLDAHADRIARGHIAVGGDLNIDALGTGNGSRGAGLYREIAGRCASLGLVSAYHAATGHEPGAERSMTYFHRRRPAEGFHLDHLFVPRAWGGRLRVEVGEPARWLALSDHMPLVVDVDPAAFSVAE